MTRTEIISGMLLLIVYVIWMGTLFMGMLFMRG